MTAKPTSVQAAGTPSYMALEPDNSLVPNAAFSLLKGHCGGPTCDSLHASRPFCTTPWLLHLQPSDGFLPRSGDATRRCIVSLIRTPRGCSRLNWDQPCLAPPCRRRGPAMIRRCWHSRRRSVRILPELNQIRCRRRGTQTRPLSLGAVLQRESCCKALQQGASPAAMTDWEVPRHRGSRTNGAYANEAQKLGS